MLIIEMTLRQLANCIERARPETSCYFGTAAKQHRFCLEGRRLPRLLVWYVITVNNHLSFGLNGHPLYMGPRYLFYHSYLSIACSMEFRGGTAAVQSASVVRRRNQQAEHASILSSFDWIRLTRMTQKMLALDRSHGRRWHLIRRR